MASRSKDPPLPSRKERLSLLFEKLIRFFRTGEAIKPSEPTIDGTQKLTANNNVQVPALDEPQQAATATPVTYAVSPELQRLQKLEERFEETDKSTESFRKIILDEIEKTNLHSLNLCRLLWDMYDRGSFFPDVQPVTDWEIPRASLAAAAPRDNYHLTAKLGHVLTTEGITTHKKLVVTWTSRTPDGTKRSHKSYLRIPYYWNWKHRQVVIAAIIDLALRNSQVWRVLMAEGELDIDTDAWERVLDIVCPNANLPKQRILPAIHLIYSEDKIVLKTKFTALDEQGAHVEYVYELDPELLDFELLSQKPPQAGYHTRWQIDVVSEDNIDWQADSSLSTAVDLLRSAAKEYGGRIMSESALHNSIDNYMGSAKKEDGLQKGGIYGGEQMFRVCYSSSRDMFIIYPAPSLLKDVGQQLYRVLVHGYYAKNLERGFSIKRRMEAVWLQSRKLTHAYWAGACTADTLNKWRTLLTYPEQSPFTLSGELQEDLALQIMVQSDQAHIDAQDRVLYEGRFARRKSRSAFARVHDPLYAEAITYVQPGSDTAASLEVFAEWRPEHPEADLAYSSFGIGKSNPDRLSCDL